MKKYASFLACVLLCVALCACGEKTQEPDPETDVPNVETKLSQSKAESIAKQEVVNLCCSERGVQRITFLSYNVVDAYYFDLGEPYSCWEIEVKGMFYPVDSYGDYGDRYKFDAIIKVNNSGYARKEEFSCRRD